MSGRCVPETGLAEPWYSPRTVRSVSSHQMRLLGRAPTRTGLFFATNNGFPSALAPLLEWPQRRAIHPFASRGWISLHFPSANIASLPRSMGGGALGGERNARLPGVAPELADRTVETGRGSLIRHRWLCKV